MSKRGRDAEKDADYLTSHMSDWMIRSIVAGTITVAARGGFKTPEAGGRSAIFAGDCNRQRGT